MPQCVINDPLTAELVEGEPLNRQILKLVDERDMISLDTLIVLLPQFSWSQIFHEVDGLAREGQIVLRKHRYDYSLFSVNHPVY